MRAGLNRRLPRDPEAGLQAGGQPHGPCALHVAQDIDDDPGESGVTLRAPAQMNDRLIVPDGRQRLDHLTRRVARQLGDQRATGGASAQGAQRDGRRPANGGGRIAQAGP